MRPTSHLTNNHNFLYPVHQLPGWMHRHPMLCYIKPSADPGVIEPLHVIQKTCQPGGASRATHHAGMQADVHHFWRRFALGVEKIKRILKIGVETVS